MMITFIGEDFKDGLEVEFPAVPRVGDLVGIRGPGGRTVQTVSRVEWDISDQDRFHGVEVHLSYNA